jgi:hypothetical protein
MRVITIVLQETENDGVIGTIEVNPPIAWEERCKTKLERVATVMDNAAYEYGVKLVHVNQAQG